MKKIINLINSALFYYRAQRTKHYRDLFLADMYELKHMYDNEYNEQLENMRFRNPELREKAKMNLKFLYGRKVALNEAIRRFNKAFRLKNN